MSSLIASPRRLRLPCLQRRCGAVDVRHVEPVCRPGVVSAAAAAAAPSPCVLWHDEEVAAAPLASRARTSCSPLTNRQRTKRVRAEARRRHLSLIWVCLRPRSFVLPLSLPLSYLLPPISSLPSPLLALDVSRRHLANGAKSDFCLSSLSLSLSLSLPPSLPASQRAEGRAKHLTPVARGQSGCRSRSVSAGRAGNDLWDVDAAEWINRVTHELRRTASS